jgi:hypothetical protein
MMQGRVPGLIFPLSKITYMGADGERVLGIRIFLIKGLDVSIYLTMPGHNPRADITEACHGPGFGSASGISHQKYDWPMKTSGSYHG